MNTSAENATLNGIIQSAGFNGTSSNIAWKNGMYITLNVMVPTQATASSSSLFERTPVLSIDSSSDLKAKGINSIMLIIVANVSVLSA